MITFRLGLAAALAIMLGSSVAAQAPITVRVVSIATDSGAQSFYAQKKGFFKRAKLDVDSTVMNSAAIGPAVASGTVDIGLTSMVALVVARAHGAPFVMIAPASIYSVKLRPTEGIVVAKNSPLETPRDLNGKIIGITGLQNIGQLSADAFVDKNGGDSGTIKFIEIPTATMIPALESGRVSAVELGEPVLDEALARGNRSLGTGYKDIADQFAIAAWFCTSTYAQAHPDIVRRYAAVMGETARWANTHQADSAPLLADLSKIEVTPTMARVVYGDHLDAAMVQPIIASAAKYGLIQTSFAAKDLFPAGMGR